MLKTRDKILTDLRGWVMTKFKEQYTVKLTEETVEGRVAARRVEQAKRRADHWPERE